MHKIKKKKTVAAANNALAGIFKKSDTLKRNVVDNSLNSRDSEWEGCQEGKNLHQKKAKT